MIKKFNLSRQLLCIVVVIFGVITVAIGFLLPRVLLPVYENNIYTILKQPLEFMDSPNFEDYDFDSDIAYLYLNKDNKIIVSTNIRSVINLSSDQIISKIDKKSGNFSYLGNIYYYISEKEGDITKVAITNDNYITKIKEEIIDIIFPVLLFTLLIIVGLVLLWSQLLIKKIEKLKEKIDNLDNDNYIDRFNYYFDDELKSLSNSINKMKETLREQEDYKNQMYQNISHDFKTPLTVIKSYLEGMEDGIQDKEEGSRIISDQVSKLEMKVHSLLYLNKLNYIKDLNNYKHETTDVCKVITESVEKFKIQRPDVVWELSITEKKR